MEALLISGNQVFQIADVFDANELARRNAPLRTRCFDVQGKALQWVPATLPHRDLPIATLTERALVAFETSLAEAEYQEQQRREQEVQRRRLELQRLMRCVLDEAIDISGMTLTPGVLDADDAVTVAVDGLTFRTCRNSSGFSLQMASHCPACSETCWTTIDGLPSLGAFLTSLPEAELSADNEVHIASPAKRPFCSLCPTCERLAADPFFAE